MVTSDGFTVKVIVDEQPLQEYGTLTDRSDPSRMSCWVGSTEGKDFSVRVEWDFEEESNQETTQSTSQPEVSLSGDSPRSPRAFRFELSCDGHRTSSKCTKENQGHKLFSRIVSGERYYNLRFAPLARTDDKDAENKILHPSFGSLEIQVWRISPDWSKEPRNPILDLDMGPIHEKMKKVGGHRVGLGEVLDRKLTRRIISTTKLDKEPYKIFTFNYRPVELLRAQGIIKDSSKGPKRNRKRRASEMEDDEDPEEGGEQATATVVKRENERTSSGSSDDEDVIEAEMQRLVKKLEKARSKKVKRETSPIRLSCSGELIDLTSD